MTTTHTLLALARREYRGNVNIIQRLHDIPTTVASVAQASSYTLHSIIVIAVLPLSTCTCFARPCIDQLHAALSLSLPQPHRTPLLPQFFSVLLFTLFFFSLFMHVYPFWHPHGLGFSIERRRFCKSHRMYIYNFSLFLSLLFSFWVYRFLDVP